MVERRSKKTETALEAAVELFRCDTARLEALLQAVGDALFIVDAERNIVFWNRQAELLTGFEADEVLGKYCLAGIRCESCLYDCALFTENRLEDVEVTLRSKDGGVIYAKKDAFVLRGERGEVLGGIEFLRDQTELVVQIRRCREQGQAIAQREGLQSAVLSSIKEGVITLDPQRRITSFSRRAEAMTGYRADEVVGRLCHELFAAEGCDKNCPVRTCLASTTRETERVTRIRTASGQRLPVAEIAVPLRDDDGDPFGVVLILEDRSQSAAMGSRSKSFAGMVGHSDAMRTVFRVVEQVAPTEATVLVTGESGTGKERVARALHELSGRAEGPFQAINCAALPEQLLESELFGHVRGAFTGAVRDRPGRIEQAEGGTLFLDEIGEMPPSLQSKLLRFLQEREYQRVGESKSREANVRVISATNRILSEEVAAGRFREDLYYRIKVIPIELPPLRQRREDIPLLAAHILEQAAKRLDKNGAALTRGCVEQLVEHSWPGNVRELANAIEYAVTLAPSRRIRAEDLPPEIGGKKTRYSAPDEEKQDEAELILSTLEKTGGNKSQAATILGMNRVTLYRKLKKYGWDKD